MADARPQPGADRLLDRGGKDYALVLWKDELDIEYIRLYTIAN